MKTLVLLLLAGALSGCSSPKFRPLPPVYRVYPLPAPLLGATDVPVASLTLLPPVRLGKK